MKNLSKIAKSRIALRIVEDLKEVSNDNFYVSEDSNELIIKIAKKAKVSTSQNYRECGMVDISEYIQFTFEELEDRLYKKINEIQQRKSPSRNFNPEFKVSDELKEKTEKFAKENIKQSGTSSTSMGEIFRALQYIEYRAMNDGDLPWHIFSPTFSSYMFVISQIDLMNYSGKTYNEETGEHKLNFQDKFLQENSWDGKISSVIEGSRCQESEFIRYQLIDLLNSGEIKDEQNEFDSRSFKRFI